MTLYDFDRQLSKGEAAERFLDSYFIDRFEIQRVTHEEQRRGRDRILTSRETGRSESVEYKTDWVAARTGNVFVETVSVDATNKPGWALTCTADLIFYYVPGDELIYVIQPDVIRAHLEEWCKYPLRSVVNDGYKTWGLCVPMVEFERYSREVISC